MKFNSTSIDQMTESLPELIAPKELVLIGLFPSLTTLHRLRKRGDGPGYFLLSQKVIRYPKDELIKYLKRQWRSQSNVEAKTISEKMH